MLGKLKETCEDGILGVVDKMNLQITLLEDKVAINKKVEEQALTSIQAVFDSLLAKI